MIGLGQEIGFLIVVSLGRGQFQKASSNKLENEKQPEYLICMNG